MRVKWYKENEFERIAIDQDRRMRKFYFDPTSQLRMRFFEDMSCSFPQVSTLRERLGMS